MFSRRADSLNSMGFAAMVLLMPSPLAAGQTGLQLSFAATMGIVLLQGRIAAPAKRWMKQIPGFASRALRPVNEGLAVTAAATAFTLPVQLLRLPGGVSALTFLSNLFFVPLSGAVMILGGLSALLGGVPLLSTPLVNLAEPLGKLLLRGVHWLDQMPAPMFRGNETTLAFPFALCAGIVAVALWLRWRGKAVRVRLVAGLVCAVLVLGGWLPGHLKSRRTRLEQIKTGNGVCWLVSRGSRAALLGCGGDEFPASVVKRALSAAGTRQLELLLLPGVEDIFSAGAAELLRDVPIADMIEHPEGITEFKLWDDVTGIYYQNGGQRACLLHTEDGYFVLRFRGPLPEHWMEAAVLGVDKRDRMPAAKQRKRLEAALCHLWR
jgi:competence protein ComEC